MRCEMDPAHSVRLATCIATVSGSCNREESLFASHNVDRSTMGASL